MVKFVSYSGQYPNRCSGVLVLEIDGERCETIELVPRSYMNTMSEHVRPRNWEIRNLPEKYEKERREILKAINANIPRGCCGGCI